MRKLVLVLITSAALVGCNDQSTELRAEVAALHTEVAALRKQSKQHAVAISYLNISSRHQGRHLQRLDAQITDAEPYIPILRAR